MKNLTDREILKILRKFNETYASQGFKIVGLFGSYARNEATDFSDIDLAYEIDHEKFYPDDAFRKLDAIDTIRRELEGELRRKVDLIPYPKEESPLKKRLEKELVST
ncbi:nucleotidyltransferase family protein [Hydrogenimonas sp.]